MSHQVTEFFYCDWHEARDIDRAVEAVDHGIDNDPRIPPDWVRFEIRRVVPNQDYAEQFEQRRRAAIQLAQHERADDPDAPPLTEEAIEEYVTATLALSPVEEPEVEVEVYTGALSPERAGWLALLGVEGYGGDPERVLGVAAAALPPPVLPTADDCFDAFYTPFMAEAVWAALAQIANGEIMPEQAPDVLRAALRPALTSVLDLVRAVHSAPSGTDLEAAIQTAIDTTQPQLDGPVQ
jgi:hypothetical protein